jgi:hypothetical protein
MGAGKKSVLQRCIIAGQAACLLIGIGVSLVPVLPKTYAFWGCDRTWSDQGQKHVRVSRVVEKSAWRISWRAVHFRHVTWLEASPRWPSRAIMKSSISHAPAR